MSYLALKGKATVKKLEGNIRSQGNLGRIIRSVARIWWHCSLAHHVSMFCKHPKGWQSNRLPQVSLPVLGKLVVPLWEPHNNPNHLQMLLTLPVLNVQHLCLEGTCRNYLQWELKIPILVSAFLLSKEANTVSSQPVSVGRNSSSQPAFIFLRVASFSILQNNSSALLFQLKSTKQ